MNLTELTIKIGVEDADGKPQMADQTITLVLENVFFIHKPPMETFKQIAVLSPQPIITEVDIPDDELIAAGLLRFDTPEGTYAWVNPEKAMFYFTPQLGVYVLAFPGGSRVGIHATGEEVRKMFGVGGSVIV